MMLRLSYISSSRRKMKKQIVINIISYIIVVCVFLCVLGFASKTLEMKNAESSYGSFFDKEKEYDVFFLGSSKVINAFFPMKLWKDYGITSYNLGAHASLLPTTYWMFENALDYKTPKVVVIDMNDLASDFKYTSPEFLHNWIDAFGLSINKIKTVVDLNEDGAKERAIEDGELDSTVKGSNIEFLWNFCKYHSRWNEINDESFEPPIRTEKGAEMRLNVASFESEETSIDKTISDDAIGVIYLKKIIEECQQKGIDVVLVNLPGQANEDIFAQSSKMLEIAEEYNIRSIDYMNMDIVDYSTDFYDDKHLNPLGATKITDHIGDYLFTEFGDAINRQDTKQELWEEDYWFYSNYKTELFDRCDTLPKSILMLKDDDFTTHIYINNYAFLNDEMTVELLSKLNVDMSSVESACAENGSCIVIIDNPEREGTQVAYEASLTDTQMNSLREKASIQEINIDNTDCNIRIIVENNVTGYIAINEF